VRFLPAGILLAAFGPVLYEWSVYVAQVARLGYCLLVPVLAAVLAWIVFERTPAPREDARGRWAGALLLLLGATLLLVGAIGGVFTFSIAGAPLCVTGLVGLRRGFAGLHRYRYALLLLAAMVPPPLPLLDRFTPAMVQASGDAAVGMLSLIEPGQITWVGSVLEFRGWTLIVAEACSGSGSMLVLGVLSLFLAGLFRMRWWTLLLTLALVLPLTLFVNGLRIALTAWALDRFGPAAVAGSAHEILGQVVVILAGAGLALAVDRLTRSKTPRAQGVAA
jgi:exosortase/archaeosortase family protein